MAASATGATAAAEKAAGRPARRALFHSLRYPNFRLFFFGQLISVAGTWMQTVAEQWLIFSLTGSAAWLGIVGGAGALPYVALGLYGGKIADRIPRRTILLWTQWAALALAVVLAVLASGRLVPIAPWHLVVLAVLLGVVNAFNMPAQQVFVHDLIDDPADLGNAIALNSLRFNVARVLGPILAGEVLVRVGAFGCFALNAVSFVAVIVSLYLLRISPRRADAADVSSDESIREGLRYVWRTPNLLRIVLLIGAASLLLWSVSTLYPVLSTRFGRGERGFSQMMTVNGLGAAVGGIVVATWGERVPRRYLVYGGAAAFALLLFAVASAPTYATLLVALGVSGFFMLMLGINANTYVQQQAPDRLRGRVMALYSLVFAALMPLGGIMVGFLAERWGARTAIFLQAGVALAATAALFAWSGAARRRRRGGAGKDAPSDTIRAREATPDAR